ncbi:MAG: metallophosphoesterase family protein [Halothiobacillaceae bacterium]
MDLAHQRLVTVALLSDTHGVLDERVRDIAAECDVAVHAGDILDPDILRALEPRSGHVIAVRGNNDTAAQWPEHTRSLLERLPESATLGLPGGQLAVEHGHRVLPAYQRHEKLRARHPDARLIVYGHTHMLLIERGASPWIANPGAAGRVRTFGGPSCIVLTATADDWHLEPHRFTK